jgi:hypothetical protein
MKTATRAFFAIPIALLKKTSLEYLRRLTAKPEASSKE